MKFLYFGTPYVASDTLKILVDRGFRPEAVITSPDAPHGRGMKLTPSPTRAAAEELGIPVLVPEKLDSDTIASLRDYHADFAIVVAYGKIFPQALIDAFPSGVINIHYSLLPKYRGASPVESALLNGETMTGISIQKMAFALDSGDVLASKEVEIEPEETTRELRPRLVTLGAELLASILPAFMESALAGVPQDASKATFCGKISKEDGLLDLAGDAMQNWNTYRAYAESPGTYFFAEKNGSQVRVKIKTATFKDGKFVPLRVTPEGKKEMDYSGFLKN